MKTIEVKQAVGKKILIHKIEIFDAPENLPIKRYQKFNKFLMKACEVGSDFSDFNTRSMKTMELLKKGMFKEALIEIDNRRQMAFNAFMEYSPENHAMAILVHKINGEIQTDYTDEGLDAILEKLDAIGLSKKEASENTDAVKKKSNKNLKYFFQKSLMKVRSMILTIPFFTNSN